MTGRFTVLIVEIELLMNPISEEVKEVRLLVKILKFWKASK